MDCITATNDGLPESARIHRATPAFRPERRDFIPELMIQQLEGSMGKESVNPE